MKVLGIIPARYASVRLPGKALADIKGKPMIQRVYEQCAQCSDLSELIIATDNAQIMSLADDIDANCMLTSENHKSGTDRCAEVANKLDEEFDFIINIQGDEPFIKPGQISELCSILKPEVEIGTLIKKINSGEDLFNENIPKVIRDHVQNAIYFSRNPIPFNRGIEENKWLENHSYYRHIGMYAYRSDTLQKIAKLPTSSLEIAESLEQLRWLENGYKIKTKETKFDSFGIDTPEDLQKAIDLAK